MGEHDKNGSSLLKPLAGANSGRDISRRATFPRVKMTFQAFAIPIFGKSIPLERLDSMARPRWTFADVMLPRHFGT